MIYFTRKWVKPEDLNPHGTLFGGCLLKWVDEEAAIYAISELGHKNIVTKFISEINFVSSAKLGAIIEMGMEVVEYGRSSITLRCEVRNKITERKILNIEKLVFVSLDEDGSPMAHGKGAK